MQIKRLTNEHLVSFVLLLSAVATTVLYSASSQRFFSVNSRTAALNWMKFCTNMYLDNCTNPVKFQVHRSKVKVTDRIGFSDMSPLLVVCALAGGLTLDAPVL